jgi:hypothetical protein
MQGLGSRSQDYVQARKWYNLAAMPFTVSDAEQRTKAVNDRDTVTQKMTSAQLASSWWRTTP